VKKRILLEDILMLTEVSVKKDWYNNDYEEDDDDDDEDESYLSKLIKYGAIGSIIGIPAYLGYKYFNQNNTNNTVINQNAVKPIDTINLNNRTDLPSDTKIDINNIAHTLTRADIKPEDRKIHKKNLYNILINNKYVPDEINKIFKNIDEIYNKNFIPNNLVDPTLDKQERRDNIIKYYNLLKNKGFTNDQITGKMAYINSMYEKKLKDYNDKIYEKNTPPVNVIGAGVSTYKQE